MTANTFYFDFEVKIIEWLQSFECGFTTLLAKILTECGQEFIIVGIIGSIYWCYNKEWGKYIGINAICGLLVAPFIKNIALRNRPYMVHKFVKCIKAPYPKEDIYDIAIQGYSMPSMHSSNSFIVYGSLAACIKKSRWRILLSAIVVLIGLSRIYLGAHYPTDVLLGWALGAVMLLLVSFMQKKIKNKLIIMIIFALATLPGWFFCKSNDFFTSYGLLVGVCGGFYIEEKFVNFENTKNVLKMILRVVGGLTLFLLLCEGLKLPFNSEFLSADTFAAHLIRALRYAVSAFAVMAFYPMLFKISKLGKG